MEKQRNTIGCKSCRRFLISLLLIFLILPLYAQTLTLEQVRQLRILPEENQNLYTKTDIKFTVAIPLVRPSQIQVISTEQSNDISFKTMRKLENYGDTGTILELWYSFEKKGEYQLSPISVMIQNRTRKISFEKISVEDDPAKMTPRIVLVFENGTEVFSDAIEENNSTKELFSVPTGQKILFTVNLQYATQLVKFTWDIPQNSIFTQTEEFEFTEVKYRERVYSHDLIPVAAFEWTGLKEGIEALPKFKISATGYNGYRSELTSPDIMIAFTSDNTGEKEEEESNIFSDAFFIEPENQTNQEYAKLTDEDCERLAKLFSKERNAFFTYFSAKRNRINFQESCGISADDSKMFTSFLLYISVFIILVCILGIIISKIKKHKIRLLVYLTIMIFAVAVFSYSHIKRCEKFGICKGCKIYSIPEENAAASSEIGAGNTVRILETAGSWLYIELGESGGWCSADNICIIK